VQDAVAQSLVCRVGDVLCALPLAHVGETMRTLPVDALAGVPAFVRGLAIVRGRPTPVIDAGALLLETGGSARRFVTVSPDDRPFMLAVDAVVGVMTLPAEVASTLPSVLQSPRLAAVVATTTLDGQLLLMLEHARLVPEAIWASVSPGGAAA
jgi:purine-binding chemotaxis protein CheW